MYVLRIVGMIEGNGNAPIEGLQSPDRDLAAGLSEVHRPAGTNKSHIPFKHAGCDADKLSESSEINTTAMHSSDVSC
jgi:hypothetical protein